MAVRVGEDLDLDVAAADHGLLQDQLARAEGALRLGAGRGEGGGEVLLGIDEAHAAAAAAGSGLDHHRKADALGLARQHRIRLVGALVAGDAGDAGFEHAPLGLRLVAHGGDGLGRRADEDEAGLAAGAGELGILGQEAVARMHGIGAEPFGGSNDGGDVEIARPDVSGADARRDIGLAHVQRIRVGLGVDGGRAVAHGLGGAHDAASDLAAVGHQDGAEHHALTCHPGAWASARVSGHPRRRKRARTRIRCDPGRFAGAASTGMTSRRRARPVVITASRSSSPMPVCASR